MGGLGANSSSQSSLQAVPTVQRQSAVQYSVRIVKMLVAVLEWIMDEVAM